MLIVSIVTLRCRKDDDMDRTIEEAQKIELALWDQLEDQDWLGNLANKLSELRWLLPKFTLYRREFENAHSVLELGGGEGWASCVVKHLYPQHRVLVSDISESAIKGAPKWERIFESSLDQRFACKSYEVPLPDNSIDLIFSFQAAHHFGLHLETLREVARILTPGGTCIYLNEPSCRKYLYPIAKWRVNAKRPECPEDVLVFEELRRIAGQLGFSLQVKYSTVTINRGVFEGVYYKFLSMFPVFCKLLPCTADFVFRKL